MTIRDRQKNGIQTIKRTYGGNDQWKPRSRQRCIYLMYVSFNFLKAIKQSLLKKWRFYLHFISLKHSIPTTYCLV